MEREGATPAGELDGDAVFQGSRRNTAKRPVADR